MISRLMFWLRALGPRHERFQERILHILLVPGIGDLLWKVASELLGKNDQFHWMHFLLALLELVVLWIVVAVVLSFSFYLASLQFNLDLHLYYGIWLRHLKPRRKLTDRETDIVESFDFFRSKDSRWKHKRPCFIEREDLQRKSFWTNWAFSIVTVFGNDKVEQQVTQVEGRSRWVLHVNLMNESYGIYSNDGKGFLKARFLTRNEGAHAEVERRSRLINESMHPGQGRRRNWKWNDSGCQLPIRWASGGFMSVVRYRQAYWVLLSFRDITPVGLNVANGASETKDEYKDPKVLIGREFCEEVVVLSGSPGKDAELSQREFATQDSFARFVNTKFAKEHANLRRTHDGFTISPVRNPTRPVKFMDTPFDVDITYHGPASEHTHEVLDNVVYTINPAEFGIEVVKLAKFNMDDEEYVIEGEVSPSRQVLIRQIPILLRLSYLSEVFTRNGSLGTIQGAGNSVDGKMMDEVPQEHCVIFDADVSLREVRRVKIRHDLATSSLDDDSRSKLQWELDRIDRWLERWGEAVANAKRDGLRGDRESERELRTLCPVTWKTLELAFVHKLFQKELDEDARARRALNQMRMKIQPVRPPSP